MSWVLKERLRRYLGTTFLPGTEPKGFYRETLTKTQKCLKDAKNILIVLEKIFFVGVEKKIGYSFDVKICKLSIYDVFRAFGARQI